MVTSADLITVSDQVRRAINTTPTKRCSNQDSRSKASSTSPTARSVLDKEKVPAHCQPKDSAGDDSKVSVATTTCVDSPLLPLANSDHKVSPAIVRIKAATIQSVLSSTIPQSPPICTQVAPQSSSPMTRSRTRAQKGIVEQGQQTNQPTSTGKRKRLSVDVVSAETKPALAKRSRVKGSSELCTPTVASQSHGLPTPSSTPMLTPALTISSGSVASTPMIAKARAAGKKQRKSRTKQDFEERVTPAKYAMIMAQRENKDTAQGHENVLRRSTRSRRVRMM